MSITLRCRGPNGQATLSGEDIRDERLSKRATEQVAI